MQAEHVEKTTEIPEETTRPPEEPQGTTEEAATEQADPTTERKISREEKNLESDLGKYWRCTDHDPHYDGSLGRRLRTRVSELIQDNKEVEHTMEDYWILENEEDPYFKAWKTTYQQINQNYKV